jgi:hypothetical protein
LFLGAQDIAVLLPQRDDTLEVLRRGFDRRKVLRKVVGDEPFSRE